MKRLNLIILLLAIVLATGCTHALKVTNNDEYFCPTPPAVSKPIKIGVTSSNTADAVNSHYVNAVIDAMQKTSHFEKVFYPYSPSIHQGQVDKLVDISVRPTYDGSGVNFFINFPGFLIFAPAIWGYKYNAIIDTKVNITDLKDNTSKQITVPTHYVFRHADMGRTWTEISWFEVGAIALIGGIVFTNYDDDVTPDFIRTVSPDYGAYVSSKIIEGMWK